MAMLATGRALRIAEEAQFTEIASQSVIGHQATNQRLANAKQEFDGLCRLQQTDDAGQYAQNSCLCATWRQLWRRRLRIETAIARPFVRLEDGQLALEAEDAAMNDRFIGNQGGVLQQIARGPVARLQAV